MKEVLNVRDYIEVEALQKIQDKFSKATGLAAITVDFQGKPVTEKSSFCEFCIVIREDPQRRKMCHRCDAHGGLQAAITGEPHFYKCYVGIVDFAIPIMVSGNYLGAVLAGQVKLENGEDKKLDYIIDCNYDYTQDERLVKLYDTIPTISYEKIQAAADMIHNVANYIVGSQYTSKMQDELNKNNLELLEQISIRAELEKSLKEAELKALQAQINPHFLFNVLNTIGRLALMEQANKTEELIYSFADIMRYTLKKNASKFVTLNEELTHVSNYLSIQKIRLEDRLKYEINIDEKYNNVMCPFMTLQPIVENSINHVIEEKLSGGKIIISAVSQEDELILSVSDDGDGISKEMIDKILSGQIYNGKDNSGIGLYNVNKRLMFYSGNNRGLHIISEEGKGTTVQVRISTCNEKGLKETEMKGKTNV